MAPKRNFNAFAAIADSDSDSDSGSESGAPSPMAKEPVQQLSQAPVQQIAQAEVDDFVAPSKKKTAKQQAQSGECFCFALANHA